jgi:hypothetical protein
MVPTRHFRLVGARETTVRSASQSSRANRTNTIVADTQPSSPVRSNWWAAGPRVLR